MRISRILKKLRAGEVARICCLYNPANAFPAYAAAADFDGIWLDSEHNTWDKREMQRLILLHGMADIDCIVRPSTLGKTELYHILEDGATGVLVPLISTVEQAEFLVDAMKFPPMGQRGLDGAGIDNDFFINGTEGYSETANRETLIAVQIETPEAIENVEKIALVEGIDVLFIGPGDLSLRFGCELNWNEPQMKAAQEKVSKAARAGGIAWGRPSVATEDIAELFRAGARFIARGSDFDAVAWSLTHRYKVDFDNALAGIDREDTG